MVKKIAQHILNFAIQAIHTKKIKTPPVWTGKLGWGGNFGIFFLKNPSKLKKISQKMVFFFINPQSL